MISVYTSCTLVNYHDYMAVFESVYIRTFDCPHLVDYDYDVFKSKLKDIALSSFYENSKCHFTNLSKIEFKCDYLTKMKLLISEDSKFGNAKYDDPIKLVNYYQNRLRILLRKLKKAIFDY